MSIYTSALRDIANNHGWGVCEEAAQEIDEMEETYALLFKENATLRARVEELRRALSDEQIDAIFNAHHNQQDDPWTNWRRFARAIESAHGITTQKSNTSS